MADSLEIQQRFEQKKIAKNSFVRRTVALLLCNKGGDGSAESKLR